MQLPANVERYLPILKWGKTYNRDTLTSDVVAAVIVTIMLIPQSLAYALLAGLPPVTGLYASIVPIILYAIFGTSAALAVGPVAVVSLMTATAVGRIAETGSMDYVTAALTLAFLSGAILLVMGIFKLGFLANFLSHPVIAGFITATGLIIAASQLKHILGISADGHSLIGLLQSLWENLGQTNWITLIIGTSVTAFLFWVRARGKDFLVGRGYTPKMAGYLAKAGPVFAVLITIIIAWLFDLKSYGVKLVGAIPQGLPPLTTPSLSWELVSALAGSALLISVIGFVESISVAQTLAAKKRQRIDANQELIGLGAANIGAAFTGGYPVTGGFARSVVNFDAGAETPAAGAFTAIGLAIASLTITPLIGWLPVATLAGTIIVAVLSLVDFSIVKKSWDYSKKDFIAVIATILLTLAFGVEIGVTAGVGVSIFIFLYRTSKPHTAIIGRMPGTEHFRNTDRYDVLLDAKILSIRIDESLYFANARYLEDLIYDQARARHGLEHVVLMCTSVSEIDLSALESLESLDLRLRELGIELHLTEIKGPVMDRIKNTHFMQHLSGRVFLSQHQAICALSPDCPSEENASVA